MTVTAEREVPFVLDQGEVPAMLALQKRIQASRKPQLTSPDGPPIDLPETLYKILVDVVGELLAGRAVSILPQSLELTTTQAADILQVSRPFFTSLLKSNEIPFRMVGTHRRVRLEDVVRYAHARDAQRERILGEMIQEADEAGLYDDLFAEVRSRRQKRG
jgi:excisionase family DNA binding protein